VDRIRLVSWATLFFVSHLGVFYLVGSAGFRIGIAFFLWVGIFNVFVVAQFWAFANDIYSQEQGKRLFPIISVGASLGAWIGTQIIGRTFASLGAYVPMIIGGGILILCVLITIWVNRRMLASGGVAEQKKAREPLGEACPFQLIKGSRYLMSIAALILLLNLVNTTGGFLHNSLVALNADAEVAAMTDATEDERDEARTIFIGEYFADFYGWVNLAGLLIQMFLVSRIFKFLGVRLSLFILPCIAIGGYALLIALPMLQIVRIVKIAENSTDYSLMNTIRAALYLPTSREVKYKAKQAIDTFFVRLGDMLQAGVVFVGTWLGLSLGSFAAVLAFFCVLWIMAAVSIYREHKKLTREA
jgi:AAA family ATP:ADP antiporter